MAKTSTKAKSSWPNKLSNFIFSAQVFPVILSFLVIGTLFVLFRMKRLEVDYKLTNLNREIEKISLENKELKAKKARMLSVKNLSKMANRHKLYPPKQKQVIVIK